MARQELGEILRQADLVSAAQLQEALSLQRVLGERLASVLVRQNILTEKFAVTYLGRQLGVPSVDLSRHEIDLGLLQFVPLDLCERHLIFPVRIDGTRLLLAMSDPLDHKLVSEIEFKTGVRLAPTIALDAAIKNAILEARRALKAGLTRIQPQVQKPRDAPPAQANARVPGEPEQAAPSEPHALPVQPIDEKHEKAIFETLGGSLLHPPAAPVQAPRPPAVEETQTILAVDDDPNIVHLLEVLLQSRRYRVITAGTGREALARVKEAMPDLVILDGMLPEVHGFEICKQLKTSERFRHIPVLMMSAVHTGWRFAADVKERYGADDYVEKPFEGAELLRRVEQLLTRGPGAGGPAPAAEVAARQQLKSGVIALKQNRLEEAIESFERGLAIDGFNDLLHYYLAMTYEKKEMVFHAIDHYERAIQVNPEFYDAITAVARLYEKQDFRRKAVEMWELALQATRDEPVREQIKAHLMTLL